MEQETATLILNTYDISQSIYAPSDFYNKTVDNRFGTITNNRCTITWKNINMRQVLGKMYDNYETFNIKLYQICQTTTMINSGSAIGASSVLVDVRISGLPFINNNYNVVSRNNTSGLYLTSLALNISNYLFTGTVTQSYPICLTFGKCTEYVDITIDMKRTKDQIYPVIENVNSALGQFVYTFKIFGIPTREPNNIINGSRMNLLQR